MSQVELEWGAAGAADLARRCSTVVVCDVLSFSTALSVAVAAGIRVWPCRWNDARAAARAEAVGARLAGPRGSEISLSPASMRRVPSGSAVLLPSPNGATCCLEAEATGVAVVVGCLRNATAVARWCRDGDGDVGLVAAGERWPDGGLRPAYEDWVGAGAIAALLAAERSLTPEAEAAALAAGRRRPLAGVASGRELIAAGFGIDVAMAEEIDADGAVPVLVDGQFVAG